MNAGALPVVVAFTLLTVASIASATCYTFYPDLCEGPYSCMCTTQETCGTVANRSNAMTAAGGCAGSCRTVIHDQCSGPDSCMADAGPCVVATPPPVTAATRWGVDFAGTFTNDTFDCLSQNNISFGVVRAHHSNGGVDPNAPPMIKKMRGAGFKTVDAYLFPCTTFDAGHTGTHQVEATVEYLKANNALPDRIWFDLEWNSYTPSCDWSHTNFTYNCEFVNELVTAAAQYSEVGFGVYAQKSFWDTHLSGCTAGKDLPLWYPAYDNVQSFADWTPYGGWTQPVAKQYNDETSLCGVGSGMDASWAPNGFH